MKKSDTYGQRVWKIIYPLLTYYGVFYLVFLLAGMLAVTFSVITLEKTGAGMDYYVLLEQTAVRLARYNAEISGVVALLMLPLILFYRSLDRQKESEKRFQYAAVAPKYYLLALLLGAAACLALNGLLNLSGLLRQYEGELEEIGGTLYQGKFLIEIIAIGILMPVMEEFLFRGLIQNRIRSWLRPDLAVVVSAVVFSLYHGNILQMIYTLAMGLILGYAYEKYHNILAPVLIHAGANLVSVIGSEKGIFDVMLSEEWKLLVFTGLFCVMMVGCIYLMHNYVNSGLVQREQEEDDHGSGPYSP